mgnify:CR=1 FL=1
MKEKHDYNVWYYAHNKDKWKLQGGTNASGGSTNSRPTSTTEVKPTGSYGPKPREKKVPEKIADALLRHVPGYNRLYKDTYDFAKPFIRLYKSLKGTTVSNEVKKVEEATKDIPISEIKKKLTEWENKYNAAEKQIKDFKYKVTSVFKNNDF